MAHHDIVMAMGMALAAEHDSYTKGKHLRVVNKPVEAEDTTYCEVDCPTCGNGPTVATGDQVQVDTPLFFIQ